MIRLEPMSVPEFDASVERGVRRHAEDAVRRGIWTEQAALETSRDEFAHLFPQGRETPNHHFVLAVHAATGRKVGEAWYVSERRGGKVHFWIDWLWIEPEDRRRGYATRVLQLLEMEASRVGADRIGLSVVADNAAASALYAKLGFRPTRSHLAKDVPERPP